MLHVVFVHVDIARPVGGRATADLMDTAQVQACTAGLIGSDTLGTRAFGTNELPPSLDVLSGTGHLEVVHVHHQKEAKTRVEEATPPRGDDFEPH
jgi:hypothetical protein